MAPNGKPSAVPRSHGFQERPQVVAAHPRAADGDDLQRLAAQVRGDPEGLAEGEDRRPRRRRCRAVGQQRLVEAQPRLAGVEVEPDQADGQAEEERDEAAQPARTRAPRWSSTSASSMIAKYDGAPMLDGHVGQRRGEERHQQRCRWCRRRRSRWRRWPAPGRPGPSLAILLPSSAVITDADSPGCVQQDRGGRPAVHAAVVDAGEHDERRGRAPCCRSPAAAARPPSPGRCRAARRRRCRAARRWRRTAGSSG